MDKQHNNDCFEIKVNISINKKFIDAVMNDSLQGNVIWEWAEEVIKAQKDGVDDEINVISKGGMFIFKTYEGEILRLTMERFIKGFKKYINWIVNNRGVVYTDTGLLDLYDYDRILQFALFNDIIYD